jgi:excinuclease ABC subunit C
MGISKGKHLKRAGFRKMDEFWIVRDNKVFPIDIENPSLLVDLRDEAHRFAITHYRKRARKESKRSKLESIPGVGDKRRKALLKEFGDIKGIEKASVEEINTVINNRKVSKVVKSHLLDQDT